MPKTYFVSMPADIEFTEVLEWEYKSHIEMFQEFFPIRQETTTYSWGSGVVTETWAELDDETEILIAMEVE